VNSVVRYKTLFSGNEFKQSVARFKCEIEGVDEQGNFKYKVGEIGPSSLT
jgi:hypothetical protein